MKLRIVIFSIQTMLNLSVSAAENYFRPGTIWTAEIDDDAVPAIYIVYYTILEETTFEGELVLPFVSYTDDDPEPKIEKYLRTDGDKVYWRSTIPGCSDWYLLYNFNMKEGEEVIIYEDKIEKNDHGQTIEVGNPVTLKCLRYDYYVNDNPLKGPMMRMQLMGRNEVDYSSHEDCQGNWIIGMGYAGGSGGILSPWHWGWSGGGDTILCVESPKGNIVYGESVAGIKSVSNSAIVAPDGVYNLRGERVADSSDNLPTGIYISNGKKIAVTK